MQFEIAIEGPLPDIDLLYNELKIFSAKMGKSPVWDMENRQRGKIIITEKEKYLDDTLRHLSHIMTKAENRSASETKFDIRVRNLACSEPPTGSDQFITPFNPVPEITIRPWTPSMAGLSDNKTIVLDPKDAFGTGKHPTTRLCLKLFAQMAKDRSYHQRLSNSRLLDLGCGSGILAIAAVKMGVQRALGVEIDPHSVKAAKQNVLLNGLSQKIEIRKGSWEAVHKRYDVIMANLVTSVMFIIGKRVPEYLTDQGVAIVSGFGETQAEEMKIFFEKKGLKIRRQLNLKKWSAFLISKNL